MRKFNVFKMHPVTMKPVSVIIVAHDRKEFIMDAVRSVLNQSISKNLVDILVVKKFKDNVIDSFLLKEGIKNIYVQENNLGAKVAIGIQNCEGKIVTFLEDDDIFELNKINFVLEAFKNKGLCYYHNQYNLIDSASSSFTENVETNKGKTIFFNRDVRNINLIRKAVKIGGFFNLSCISIRKSTILKYVDILSKMHVAVDNFMFYLALDSGGEMLIDSKILTGYRIHNSNDSYFDRTKGMPDLIERKSEFLKSDILGFELIEKCIKNDSLRNYVRNKICVPVVAISILSTANDSSFNAPTFRQILISLVNLRSIQFTLLTLTYILTRPFPELGKHLYFIREKTKVNDLIKIK